MDTSAAMNARSFGPLYSLFIQLQNTTRVSTKQANEEILRTLIMQN